MRNLRLPIIAVLLFAACSSSKPPDTHATTVTVTDQGGTATNDQGVVIFVPAGAIAPNSSVTFTIDPDTGNPPSGTTPVGSAWKIGPGDATFLKPITIALPVDATKLGAKTIADVAVYRAALDSDSFGPLVTSPYADGARVSCGTTSLGRFAPVLGALADAGPMTTSSSSGSSGSAGTTSTSSTSSTSTSTSTTSTSSTSTSGSSGSTGTTSTSTSSTSTSSSGSTGSTSSVSSSSGSSSSTSGSSSSSGSTGATTSSSSGSGSGSGSGSSSSTSSSGSGSGSGSGATTGSSGSGSGSGSTSSGGLFPDGGFPDGGGP